MKKEFETFRDLSSDYLVNQLKQDKPCSVNFLDYRKYNVKIELIEEPNDILLIRDFTQNFCDIKVQKIQVNGGSLSHVIDDATHSFSENILKIKNTVAKVSIPVIGLTLSAEIDAQKSLQPLLSQEASLHLQ